MNLYSQESACPKCGFFGATSTYRPANSDAARMKAYEKMVEIPEHIERECQRCDYVWREAPIDKKE